MKCQKVHCAVAENIHPPSLPEKGNGNSRGSGVAKAKVLIKEKYGAKLEWPEGWGVPAKILSIEGGEGDGYFL